MNLNSEVVIDKSGIDAASEGIGAVAVIRCVGKLLNVYSFVRKSEFRISILIGCSFGTESCDEIDGYGITY